MKLLKKYVSHFINMTPIVNEPYINDAKATNVTFIQIDKNKIPLLGAEQAPQPSTSRD